MVDDLRHGGSYSICASLDNRRPPAYRTRICSACALNAWQSQCRVSNGLFTLRVLAQTIFASTKNGCHEGIHFSLVDDQRHGGSCSICASLDNRRPPAYRTFHRSGFVCGSPVARTSLERALTQGFSPRPLSS